jgi:hypothetical protein
MGGSLTVITIMPADEAFLRSINAPTGADAMVLRDSGGTVDGYALFRMEDDAVEILRVETDLPMMTEGLIRAVLNTGDCRGAVTGVCRVAELSAVLTRLEFVEQDGVWRVSIEKFLRGLVVANVFRNKGILEQREQGRWVKTTVLNARVAVGHSHQGILLGKSAANLLRSFHQKALVRQVLNVALGERHGIHRRQPALLAQHLEAMPNESRAIHLAPLQHFPVGVVNERIARDDGIIGGKSVFTQGICHRVVFGTVEVKQCIIYVK